MSTTYSLFSEAESDPGSTGRLSTGVLPHNEIQGLIEARRLGADPGIRDDQIQPASLDIRLGRRCYRVQSSFLPGKSKTVVHRLSDLTMHELDLSEPTVLERGCLYVVEALEQLRLSEDLSARANPKSTTGRLDIFTRLITDGADRFDRVEAGYRGKLYVEVSPRTFSVRVQEGARLNQLRFTRGQPMQWDKHVRQLHEREPLLYDDAGNALPPDIDDGLWLRVDLAGRGDDGIVGYRARRHAPLIDLANVGFYPWQEFWEPIAVNDRRNLTLTPDDFYILASAERVRVPLSRGELASIAGRRRVPYSLCGVF